MRMTNTDSLKEMREKVMEIKELLSNRANYGSCRSLNNIKYIVIHYTGNDGDTAKANCNYFKNNVVKASAHYFVDDTSIYRSVPDNYVAYSVGGAIVNRAGGSLHNIATNSNTLNIEICDCKKNGIYDFTESTLRNAIELVKQKMKEYNVDINHVIRHFDVTGKNCPAPFTRGNNWQLFKDCLVKNTNKYKVGQKVLVNIPVTIAYKGSDNPQENSIVDSNGYQFWIKNSVIINNSVYGLGQVCYVQGDGLYIVQIFDNQFWCREQYLSDKF